jgi:hypothetical protein
MVVDQGIVPIAWADIGSGLVFGAAEGEDVDDLALAPGESDLTAPPTCEPTSLDPSLVVIGITRPA